MIKVSQFVPAVILFIGAGFMLRTRGQSAVPLAASLDTVLESVDGFSTINQTISAEAQRVAGMTNWVARAYKKDSVIAFTALVSYYERQTQGKTIHSPKNCLPGAGWEIMKADATTLAVGGALYPVNHYILKNGKATAVVYYWYQGRGRVVANEYQVKWNLLRDAAVAGHTEEALVRVVAYVPRNLHASDLTKTAEFQSADSLGRAISQRLVTEVNRVLPARGAVATAQAARTASRVALSSR
ncbi:MAG: exosortase C-terminal domain/associated protein EpsI [Gemmatimonadota bacterium]